MSDVLVLKTRPSHLTNTFYYIGMLIVFFSLSMLSETVSPVVVEICAWINELLFQKNRDFVLQISEISFYALMFLPLTLIVWRFVETELNVFYFYEDRLVFYHGVLHRHRENVEYYRIKDHFVSRPFYIAVFGLSNISFISTDRRHPTVTLAGFRQVNEYEVRLRRLIEESKADGRGREVDVV